MYSGLHVRAHLCPLHVLTPFFSACVVASGWQPFYLSVTNVDTTITLWIGQKILSKFFHIDTCKIYNPVVHLCYYCGEKIFKVLPHWNMQKLWPCCQWSSIFSWDAHLWYWLVVPTWLSTSPNHNPSLKTHHRLFYKLCMKRNIKYFVDLLRTL